MYEKVFKYLEFLAPPAPIIVGVWSLVMLICCVYSVYWTKQVSMPVAMIFSAVLTNFTAHKIAKVMNGPVAVNNNTKDLDVQGDDNGDTDKLSK